MGAVGAVMLKELRVEFRNKHAITSYLILAVMMLTAFRFAFEYVGDEFARLSAPMIWITFFFAGLFAMGPTYRREVEEGTLEGLLLSPVPPSRIYFGKFLANLLVIYALEAVCIVLFFAFFPVAFPDAVGFLALVVLGTVGFVALGNLMSAITSHMGQSEVMLFVLQVPLVLFTILMPAISATSELFLGGSVYSILDEIRFIFAFSVVYVALGYILIDYVLE